MKISLSLISNLQSLFFTQNISPLLIAWLQLSHKKSRLIITTLGVTFSVLLMFIQLGLRDGMYEDSVTIHKTLAADIVLLSSQTDSFWKISARPLPRSILYNLLSVPGVESVSPFYAGRGNFRNPNNFVKKNIVVCAFKLDKPVFNLPEINQQLGLLQKSDTFLFDKLSRSEYGPIAQKLATQGTLFTELSNHRIRVAGTFAIGGGVFSADGLLITSDLNYAEILNEPLEKVHLGLIKLQSGIKPETVIQSINEKLTSDIQAITLEKFMELEKKYWAKATPIGFIFNILAFISFIFGAIIVYQIIFTQISDYLDVYATLKAIGYTNIYLISTVFQEAFLMSVLGYIPGFAICQYVYSFIEGATRLPMFMTSGRALLVFFLTIFMCSVAGMLAMNKLRFADPADLF
ncbi:FtsX-like permease family protein [Nostoc sp. UHCC 0702]|nr:FtsX-like permease family protein [Nostoc sp. UHCC 0702]